MQRKTRKEKEVTLRALLFSAAADDPNVYLAIKIENESMYIYERKDAAGYVFYNPFTKSEVTILAENLFKTYQDAKRGELNYFSSPKSPQEDN